MIKILKSSENSANNVEKCESCGNSDDIYGVILETPNSGESTRICLCYDCLRELDYSINSIRNKRVDEYYNDYINMVFN